jgi:hypothetical protein
MTNHFLLFFVVFFFFFFLFFVNCHLPYRGNVIWGSVKGLMFAANFFLLPTRREKNEKPLFAVFRCFFCFCFFRKLPLTISRKRHLGFRKRIDVCCHFFSRKGVIGRVVHDHDKGVVDGRANGGDERVDGEVRKNKISN